MIIAIDGLDGAGKETTCKLLSERISTGLSEAKGVPIDTYIHSFPDYTIESGMVIANVLAGNEVIDVPPAIKIHMVVTLFAYNRKEHLDMFKKKYGPDIFDKDNTVHIFDRYWASNILYQGLGKSDFMLAKFAEYCKAVDVIYGNVLPDIYYFLRVPYSILYKRIRSRKSKAGIEHDMYEDDSFQKAVYHLSEYILANPQRDRQLEIYDKVINAYETHVNGLALPEPTDRPVESIVDEIYDHFYLYTGMVGKERRVNQS